MAKPHPQKQEFMAAVHEHLSTVGSNNWNVVLNRFPDISVPSKWRWIEQAKSADVPRPQLINARARLVRDAKKMPKDERRLEAEENGTVRISRQLPASPSPNFIARTGEEGLQKLDFVAEIHNLYRDAGMLRAFAIKVETSETGEKTEKIKNPGAFDKSIVRRAELLETAIKAVQEVWDLRTMQNFYETIIDEIGKESPATQKRIMERLAVLNSRQGMSMSFRL